MDGPQGQESPMKKIIVSLLLILFPACLFADIDLERIIQEGNKLKTPVGMIPRQDSSGVQRQVFQPSNPSEATTRLYSTERSSKESASKLVLAAGYLYLSNIYFYLVVAKGSQDVGAHFAEVRNTLVDSGVTASLADYDRYTQCTQSFPLSTPWNKWSEEQKKKWNDNDCGWSQLVYESIPKELKGSPQEYFFYWLGIDSTRLAGYVGHYVIDEEDEISSVMDELIPAVHGFVSAQNDPVSRKLSPEASAEVNTIARMNAKVDAGAQSLTNDDIDRLVQAGRNIITLTTAGNLLQ